MGSFLKLGGLALMVLGVLVGPLVFLRAGGFPGLIGLLVLGAAPLAIGWVMFSKGGRQAKLEAENAERGFSEVATALARKAGGQVGLDAVCKASSLSTDEAQAKMRALTGKGLFELDFDANGQMVYKLSAQAGAAQLARFAEKA
jgi:hypothetical protein